MKTNPIEQRTTAWGDITCPKCGHIGQEKLRNVHGNGILYRYVDHYRTFKRVGEKALHGTYVSSCYLGRIN